MKNPPLFLNQIIRFVAERAFWLCGKRQTDGPDDLSQVRRVLVVRPDEIGDVVMTTGFLRELRQNLPQAWITLVVQPRVYNFVALCPYVNEVLTYDWYTKGYFRQVRRYWRALCLAGRHFWALPFDLAILPRWDADDYLASLVVYFSGATRRVAYAEDVVLRKRELNKDFDRFFTCLFHDNDLKHEVERNMKIIRLMGGQIQDDALEIWVNGQDEAVVERMLNEDMVSNTPLIALGVGARDLRRIWPLDRFAQLGAWLHEAYNARVVIIGDENDKPLGAQLQEALGSRVCNLAGRTTLRQVGALLKRCHLFVGNDAGPMHMAAAAGTPVIEISCHPLSGSIPHHHSPQRFGPWGVHHIVLQPQEGHPPCEDGCDADRPHCIQAITVADVKEAAIRLLSIKKDPSLG